MSSITRDLAIKAATDVIAAIMRTLAIAPKPWLPIAGAAAGAALGPVAFELDRIAGAPRGELPDNANILLAGLISARLGMTPQSSDPISDAYKDFEVLSGAGLVPSGKVSA